MLIVFLTSVLLCSAAESNVRNINSEILSLSDKGEWKGNELCGLYCNNGGKNINGVCSCEGTGYSGAYCEIGM
jgi:hypothetical protein